MKVLSLLQHLIKTLIFLVDYVGTKISVKFNGDCLKKEKITFNYGKIVKIYITNKIERNVNISGYPTLVNYSFGAVRLIKHIDVDLCKYLGCGIRFDRKRSYSIGDEIGRNVIIFVVDRSSSAHIDNQKKDIFSCTRIRTYTDYRKIIFIYLY